MGRALLFILVAIATGALVYWLVQKNNVSPQTLPTPRPASESQQTSSPPQRPRIEVPSQNSPPATAKPLAPEARSVDIPAPRTDKEKERDDIESKRSTFYKQVRIQAGDVVESLQPKDGDLATLDVRVATDNPQNATPLVDLIVKAGAYQNGFRHIRCFVANSAGTPSGNRLEAEANVDDSGHWFIFRK